MANEVSTRFTADATDLFKKSDQAEARLKSLNTQLNSFGQNPTFGRSPLAAPSYKPIDSELAKATAAISNFEKNRVLISNSSLSEIERGEKALTRIKISEAKAASDTAIREIRERERAEKQSQLRGRNGTGSDILGGLGVPIGIGAGVALGANVLKNAADAAFDAERANRQLSASATQAGLSYQFLAEKAKGFADEGGLSQTSANRTEGLIAKLAQAAGRPQDLDKIETALLDTASARGLQVSQLETLVNAVISGSSDEPLNAVGLADPGKSAKDYAEKLGKSTEALTKQEQVLSRFLPLMQQADTVTGANADRMQSLSGQAETASARLDDLQTNVGKGIINSLEFRDALTLANDVLGSMSVNISDVQKKLAQGFTPRQVAEQEAEKTGNKVLDFTKSVLSFPFANVAYAVDLVTDGFEEANKKYIATLTGAKERRVNTLTGLFEGENKVLEKQNQAAEKQKVFLNLQTFEDQEKSRNEQKKKDLESRRKTFDSRFSNVGGLDDINQNRQLLNELNQNRDLFSPEEFAKKVHDTQKEINDEIKKGTDKVKELGKVYSDTFDKLFQKSGANNPFVSIFSEGDRAITELRKNLAGLSPELKVIAEQMQQKITGDSLFNARLDNDFARFDLTEEANSFRNFRQPKIEDPNKFFNDFLEAGLKQLASSNGGGTRFNLTGEGNSTFGYSQSNANPFTRYNSNIFADGKNPDGTPKQFTAGFSQSDARNDLFYSYDRVSNGDGGFGGFSRRNRSFADLTSREKDDFINKDNLSFQDKLARQIDLAQNRSALNDEQKRSVDRKLISLTQGIDPSKLTSSQRDAAAAVREREAERLDQNEARAREQRQQQIELQTRIAASNEELIELAGKGGSGAIELVLKNESDAAAELKQAATARDTQKAYDDAYTGGTFYQESRR